MDGAIRLPFAGHVATIALDPIEKKPLYHYMPGHQVLSLGFLGCNLACRFCQNWTISQSVKEAPSSPPKALSALELVGLLDQYAATGCVGVAYTYSEPVVWYEYLMELGTAVKEAGYHNILVTNGFINARPWKDLLGVIDAVNVDVKGFTEAFYQDVCDGSLEPVVRNVEAAVTAGLHVEVTYLVIPGGTDDPATFLAFAKWLRSLDPNIALHLNRYYPNYRMSVPPTPKKTLLKLKEKAMQELNNVYLGNIWVPGASDSYCSNCGQRLVRREGYRTQNEGLTALGNCKRCKTESGIILRRNPRKGER